MSYDLAGLREEVKFRLQSQERFTDDIVDAAINRGITDLTLFAAAAEDYDVYECYPPKDAADSSKYAVEMPMPTDSDGNNVCLYLKSVSYDSVPLKRLSQPQFVETGAEQSSAVGIPVYFYVRGNTWINVWPRPSDGTKKFQIYFLKKQPDLALDDDVPHLNVAFSAPIIEYASWWLLRSQPEEDARANTLLQDYMRDRAWARYNLDRNSSFRTVRTRR